ncbi:hypothetical protein ACFV4F_01655 [Kitasatospora sp. NPDC059722]|uniref:hypothetical protein n=1 Tax=unclassified Kitasatospora TaxID=2633591 RepID=UPI0036509839
MTGIEDLRAATRLLLDLSFSWEAKAPDNDAPIVDKTGKASVPAVAFDKASGSLDFVMDAQRLQIPSLQSPLAVQMTGVKLDDSSIKWVPSLPNGPVGVKIKGAGSATITGVGGQISAKLTSLNPALSKSGGPQDLRPYAFDVQLATLGAANGLTADFSASIDGRLYLNNLTVSGLAGQLEELSLSIERLPTSECVEVPVAGGTSILKAVVTGVPRGATLAYSWSAAGGTVIGSTTDSLLEVRLPAAIGTVVTVGLTVTVTDAGGATSLVATPFPVLGADPQLAQRMEKLCKIMEEAPSNWFVNPLWDPLRDLVVHPNEPALQRTADVLIRLGEAVRNLHDGTA